MQGKGERLGVLFARMAATGPQVDAKLQLHNAARFRRFEEHMEAAGVPLDHPLARAVAPTLLRAQETTIEVDLQLTESRERRLGLDLNVLGRTVTSFMETVHGSSATRSMRVALTVQDATVRAEPTPDLVPEEGKQDV